MDIVDALTHSDKNVRREAITRGNLSPEQIEQSLTDIDSAMRYHAVERYGSVLSEEQLERALTDDISSIRSSSVGRGRNLSAKQLERALTDDNYMVRYHAVKVWSLTPDQFDRALKDEDAYVCVAAVNRGGLSPKQLEAALTHEMPFVRVSAINHGGLSSEQIRRALKDNEPSVRLGAEKLAASLIENESCTDMQVLLQKQLPMLGFEVNAAEASAAVRGIGTQNGTFTGIVLKVDKELGLVFQSKGCGCARALSLKAFTTEPVEGEMVRAAFKDGRAELTTLDLGRGVGVGR